MKIVKWFLPFLFLISAAANANKAQEFLFNHQRLLNLALKAGVSERCIYYSEHSLKKANDCRLAAEALPTALDLETFQVQKSVLVLSFSKQFHSLLNDKKVQAILRSFLQPTEDVSNLKSNVETFLSKDLSDPWTEFMAVLFQDTAEALPLHVRQKYQAGNPDLVKLYEKAHQKLIRLLKDPEQKSAVRLHSASEEFYHFYVIQYLSQKLAKVSTPEAAAFSSFLFNYIYEINERQGALKSAYKEPQMYRLIHVKDLYMGYIGAFYYRSDLMSYRDFFEMISGSTKDGLRYLGRLE